MLGVDGIEVMFWIFVFIEFELFLWIIVLIIFDLDEYVFGVIRVGVFGFLFKHVLWVQLFDVICIVHVGDGLFLLLIMCWLIEHVVTSVLLCVVFVFLIVFVYLTLCE